ncbi:MAG: T9SS type A sorting domain-containing protein [Ignavibacteriaceae bacterium]|nr:T9SS type A sorting domain-containing protein [Ignavibacteriaceae bacterium]
MKKYFLLSLLFQLFSATIIIAQDFWETSNNGLNANHIYSLSVQSNNHIIAGSLGKGVFLSTDNGTNWNEINSGFPDSSNVYSLAVNSNDYIFASTDEGVFCSIDNGENWAIKMPNTSTGALAIDSNNIIFVDTDDGIYRSTDNGEIWSKTNNGLPQHFINFSFAINSKNHIFTGSGGAYQVYGVYRSTDSGDNWIEINNGLPSDINTFSLAVNSYDDIFMGSENYGVFVSTDNGDNWTEKNNGLPVNSAVYTLAINSSNQIFAGVWNKGVYFSTDFGNNWAQINTGLTTNNVRILTINPSGYIFAGTYGKGIFKSINSTTSILGEGITPPMFILNQNYPNPFNPSTKVSYSIPYITKVKVEIFNSLGQQVQTLVDEEKEAGSYSVEFDGEGLTSGVYFYQLSAGDFKLSKKMILIR